MQTFITGQSILDKNWGVDKLWLICTMKFCTAIKSNKMYSTSSLNLRNIMVSERRQIRSLYWMIPFIHDFRRRQNRKHQWLPGTGVGEIEGSKKAFYGDETASILIVTTLSHIINHNSSNYTLKINAFYLI